MFKVVNTWKGAQSPENQQRGMPAPGTGAQRTYPPRLQNPDSVVWTDQAPYMGEDTWDQIMGYAEGNPAYPVDAQRGSPAPQAPNTRYAPGELTSPVPDGNTYYRVTRQFSRGAQRNAPITGYILSTPNPGTRVPNKPNVVPRYPLGQYINNTIFWANQVIPTTIKLQGLQTQKAVDAILSTFQVYGKAETL